MSERTSNCADRTRRFKDQLPPEAKDLGCKYFVFDARSDKPGKIRSIPARSPPVESLSTSVSIDKSEREGRGPHNLKAPTRKRNCMTEKKPRSTRLKFIVNTAQKYEPGHTPPARVGRQTGRSASCRAAQLPQVGTSRGAPPSAPPSLVKEEPREGAIPPARERRRLPSLLSVLGDEYRRTPPHGRIFKRHLHQYNPYPTVRMPSIKRKGSLLKRPPGSSPPVPIDDPPSAASSLQLLAEANAAQAMYMGMSSRSDFGEPPIPPTCAESNPHSRCPPLPHIGLTGRFATASAAAMSGTRLSRPQSDNISVLYDPHASPGMPTGCPSENRLPLPGCSALAAGGGPASNIALRQILHKRAQGRRTLQARAGFQRGSMMAPDRDKGRMHSRISLMDKPLSSDALLLDFDLRTGAVVALGEAGPSRMAAVDSARMGEPSSSASTFAHAPPVMPPPQVYRRGRMGPVVASPSSL